MKIVLAFGVSLAAATECPGFTPDAASLACFFKGCLNKDASGNCWECCDGCHIEKKDISYCMEDDGPSPSPAPTPGSDTWDSYEVAGMQVQSVVGGQDPTAYDKVVIMLHGGGGSGSDWQYQYNNGWLGDLTGMKYVFPTSHIASHVWFNTYKNGCGLKDDCAYDIPSIQDSASRVAQLIEQERTSLGGDGSKVYLAGFSEGAQLTGYVQLAQLDFALGGTIVMDGYPIPPLCDMPGHSQGEARANATYYGADMNWMIFHGSADPIFPLSETMTAWHGIFDALDVRSTLKIDHTEPGMTHTLIKSEFDMLVNFVRGEATATMV